MLRGVSVLPTAFYTYLEEPQVMGVARFLQTKQGAVTDPAMRSPGELDLSVGQVHPQHLSLLWWTWTHLLLCPKKVSQ